MRRFARHSTLVLSLVLLLARAVLADEPARQGALVIVGGGRIPDEVRNRFMALAGNKAAKLVIIPTASAAADKKENEEGYLEPWRKHSPARLTLLHTRSRAQADSSSFVQPIVEATAVWFGGGDQAQLVTTYRGTAVDRRHIGWRGRDVGRYD
jgi:cyanophycinase